MKQSRYLLLGIVFFLTSLISAQAQDLISVNELAKISKNSDVVVVWAGDEDGYKVHITGAVSIPHTSLCNNDPIRNLIKPTAEMAKILGEKGVSTDKTIVVYDEGSGKYANRMYWMLKYLGAPNVKVLDGNFKAWKAGRKPVTGSPSKVAATTFNAKPNAALLANMDEVKKAIGNPAYAVIDARTAEEFAGTAETEIRKGHIPGASNINYETLLDSKGMLKSKEELQSIFKDKGITSDKTAIVYCETSVRACVLYTALKTLEYPKVKVYDGAYLEWQATASNSVE
ncbi:sulfurtransferase [Maribellus luteus]|uniref:Sulfurtransferase n=1 Tax=Maribellus luteus TaxID=2305463 RepID=A0A399T633_9BACT|nr:sulfurtransferase [Maribellus luteus]RIJ49343.1 sulfurtransferase [Maribellus luteus]